MELYFKKYPFDRRGSEADEKALPPLFILHGLFGAGGNWHTLASKTFSRVADVYAIDQRNHGRSPHADSFTLEDMVGDLVETMDRLGIERASILGHSMGGKTAMKFALLYPDRVEKLIVVDIAPVAYPDRHHYIFEGLMAINPSEYASREEINRALAAYIESALVRQFLMKNLSRHDGSMAWSLNLGVIYQAYKELSGVVEGWPPFSGDALFLRGDKSDYIKEEDIPAIEALFPTAKLVTVSGSGHWVHAENPTDFGASVVSFLTDGSGPV